VNAVMRFEHRLDDSPGGLDGVLAREESAIADHGIA
jgi:hypothetical protein